MTRPPPRSTLFPYRRSSDLIRRVQARFSEAVYVPLEGKPRPEADDGVRITRGRIKIAITPVLDLTDRKSTRLNSSHRCISYAVFCLKKKKKQTKGYEVTQHK